MRESQINNTNVNQGQNQSSRQQKKRKGNFPKTNSSTIKKEPTTATRCLKCSRNHCRECRQGTNICFRCGKSGHFTRSCTTSQYTDNSQSQVQQQLNIIQSKPMDPMPSQSKARASEPPVRIYAYTKGGQETRNPN